MRNAIPREACAVLVFNPEDTEGLEDYIKEYEAQINAEYAPIESGITLTIESVELPTAIVPAEIQDNMINVLMACQDGVMRMIPTVPDTVEIHLIWQLLSLVVLKRKYVFWHAVLAIR